ncbi:MAG TPA: DUF58 domain-containing protein [Steroidobacteraceae bacterium]|uniref:DUF58 domain-containing protein n=1 Tax=Dokdonella sp. TaxID=2291710 RepID=UPI0025BDB7B8|nr:DUF58 domain-containing protein [Dokdonella sp.]HNR23528.1 DUF58 domain-containing protein [Steroidobacteraceae bacterium]
MNTTAARISLRQRLLAVAERRLPALTRLRAAEAVPITLHRGRIYVLPSRFGIAFATLLMVMLVGALNYSNNPALLLTCVLAAAAWMSLFVGFRTLAGLQLIGVSAGECHADASVELHLRFDTGTRIRPHLRLRRETAETAFALSAGSVSAVGLTVPTGQRGWLAVGRIRLWTTQPLGLFTIWSWLHPDVRVLVYPAIEQPTPAFPEGDGGHGQQATRGGDEYAGLRDYRAGDPPRRIAWKASARGDTLRVREDEHLVDRSLVFDYDAVPLTDTEARIRRLAAWVLAAESAGRSYALLTPQQTIGPGLGTHHCTACLRALALLPHASD